MLESGLYWRHPLKAMRAFYITYKHVRVFVLGVPEGWQVVLYDLQKERWLSTGCSIYGTLSEAKADAREKATAVLGRKLPELKWH